MFGRKTLDRLDKMLDEAVAGSFRESDYDETQLSRIETTKTPMANIQLYGELLRENLESGADSGE